jgi:hypothetical protein
MDVAGEVPFDDFVGVGQILPVGSASVRPPSSDFGAPAVLAGSLVVPSAGRP